MLTENEPMWKAYREQMRPLIDKLDFKEVWGWVDDKTQDEAIADLPDADTLQNAQRFLKDLVCSHYVQVPHVYTDNNGVVIEWDRVKVEFRPNNEWYVTLEKNIFEMYGPEPSFWMEETDKHPREPHFFLEDYLMKEIERPQQWTEKYEPMLTHMKIIWSTGYWDGPLSGYCNTSYNVNDLYYFECVEELTYSPRTRLAAVYELSPKEQVDAWVAHGSWLAIWKTPWRAWLWMKWRSFRWAHNFFKQDTAARQEQWKKQHKLIGYFTY